MTPSSLTPSLVTSILFGDSDISGRTTPTLKIGDKIRITNIRNSNSNDL